MEKLVYLVWSGGGTTGDLARRLTSEVGPALLTCGVRALTVHVAAGDESLDASVPLRADDATLAAVASLWLDSLDHRGPVESALGALGHRLEGYLVTESVPRDYADRDWPDGARSPGIDLVTVFEKPDRIDDQEFFARWHGSHTPLSLEIHPLWRYVRNVVARPLTRAARPLRGIVTEHFRTVEDLTDPMRFYAANGSPERMQENMRCVLEDVSTFLDLERTHSFMMHEYILRS